MAAYGKSKEIRFTSPLTSHVRLTTLTQLLAVEQQSSLEHATTRGGGARKLKRRTTTLLLSENFKL